MLGSDDVKRVDFSSVIKILLSYRSLSESFSQGEIIAELFSTFYEKSDASSDDGQVSRWANGDERVPERYAAFYSENLNSLCTDILTNIFPVLSDRLAGRKFDVHVSECHSPASTTYISTIGFSMNACRLSITL